MLHYGSSLVPLEVLEELEEEVTATEEARTTWLDHEAPLFMATALTVEEAHVPLQDGRNPTIPTGRKESYSESSLGQGSPTSKQTSSTRRWPTSKMN